MTGASPRLSLTWKFKVELGSCRFRGTEMLVCSYCKLCITNNTKMIIIIIGV